MTKTTQEAYAQGFMAKCAECGLDDQTALTLLKVAADSPGKEVLKSMLGGVAAGLTPPTAAIANIMQGGGALKGYIDEGDDYGDWSNYVPGEASYNWSRRNKRVAREMLNKDPKSHPYANIVSEHLGHLTSGAATAGLGALLGALYDRKNGLDNGAGVRTGLLLGGGVAGAASLAGIIRGLAKKRRTDEEQLARETRRRALMKYLIPGMAGEDALMRIGKSRDYIEEGKKNKDDKKGKNDKKKE